MQRVIYFLKYHNLVPIILGVVLLATAGAFANEDVRNAVIGEKIETVEGIDNSYLLAADLDNFDLGLKITNVTEDDENYYIGYIYQTLAIQNNVWQPVLKEKTLTVSRNTLGSEDLGLYVQEELGEVADYELNYLKRVQADAKKTGLTKMTASVDYTGLIGLILDIRDKILPGYKPVITEEVCDGTDNNRDGLIDEGLGRICCGTGACAVCVDSCKSGVLQTCTPGMPAAEICDGIDNNCDGGVDEGGICGLVEPPVEPVCGATHLNFCLTEIDCLNAAGFWYNETCNVGPKPPACQPTEEICDGKDNDCDNQIDEGNVCKTATGTEPVATSTEPSCQPREEVCDGVDNDCDDLIDEDLIQECGSNNIGTCRFGTQTCVSGTWGECVGAVEPVEEICNDGTDNDCDDEIDEGCEVIVETPENNTTTPEI